MLNLKPKQKPALKTTVDYQAWGEQAKSKANRWMQTLFHVSPDWHKERDIVKNNYSLGIRHFTLGHPKDAVLRFKLTTWFSPGHTDAWYYLGRAYIMNGKQGAATAAFRKAQTLKSSYKDTDALLAAIPQMFDGKAPPIKVQAASAAILTKLHQDSFLQYWKEKDIADMLAIAGTQGWVAGLPSLPMGMIIGRQLPDEYEILTIAVSPEWRSRNLAKALLNHALAEAKAKNAKAAFLEVAEDNAAARGFYENAGFATISRRKAYYKNVDGTFTDAIVMRKELVY